MPDRTMRDGTWEDGFMRDIGRRLRRAMTVQRVSGQELARALSVTGATVSRWQTGQQRISIKAAHRAAEALQVPPGWLIFGDPLDTDCEHLIGQLREMAMLSPAKRTAVLIAVMDAVAALEQEVSGA